MSPPPPPVPKPAAPGSEPEELAEEPHCERLGQEQANAVYNALRLSRREEPSDLPRIPPVSEAPPPPGLRQRAQLLSVLVRSHLRLRYLGTFLGYFWALLNPLVFIVVYYVAFRLIVRIEMEGYTAHLLTGMFPWLWFSNTLATSTSVFTAKASLIKKTALPRPILPLAELCNHTAQFLFALPLILLFLALVEGKVHASWLLLVPGMLLLQSLVLYPIALAVGLLTVFFRDIEHLVRVGLQVLFFLTPIIYPMQMVPARYRWLALLNPATALIEAWRSALLEGALDLHLTGALLASSLVLGLVAAALHRRITPYISEVL